MKKFCTIALSLCAAAAVASAPATAYAAGSALSANYPKVFSEPLVFDALADYAVSGDNSAAFADGTKIIVLDDELRTDYEFGINVTSLDWADDNFYYTLAGADAVYLLPDSPEDLKIPGVTAEFTMQQRYNPYPFKDNTYRVADDGTKLNIWDGSDEPSAITTITGEFSLPKKYGDNLYIKNGNTVCKIQGKTLSEISTVYSNYQQLTKIKAADAAEQLKNYSQNPGIVDIADGADITGFDLNGIAPLDENGNALPAPEFFPIVSPKESTVNNISGQALLLCETGNARVVAIGNNTYILNAENAPTFSEITVTPETDQTEATVNADDWVYATPFISNATRAFKIKAGGKLKVKSKIISSQNIPLLAHDFYLVENESGQTGYAAAEFLELNRVFNEGNASTLPDPDSHTDDNIRTVILVLVVILLVLIAAGYLTWVGTTGRKRMKKNVEQPDDGKPTDDNENK